MVNGIYQSVLQAIGGEPTPVQQDWAYITSCVLLCLCCWALMKIAEKLFHV